MKIDNVTWHMPYDFKEYNAFVQCSIMYRRKQELVDSFFFSSYTLLNTITIYELEKIMDHKYKLLKYACYTTNITMSIVANLSPLLFITFREHYGISYALLGLLILINIVTQLTVD